jgi:hypothetical protein
LAQSRRWAHVSTPQNTIVFLRVETLARLDLEPKSYFEIAFNDYHAVSAFVKNRYFLHRKAQLQKRIRNRLATIIPKQLLPYIVKKIDKIVERFYL